MTFDFVCIEGLSQRDRRRFNPSNDAREIDFSSEGNVNKTWDKIESSISRSLDTTARDLIELATAIYIADRCSLRGKEFDSRRDIRLLLPVRELSTMNSARISILEGLRNLQSDNMELSFVERDCDDDVNIVEPDSEIEADCVALLSGGLDSFAATADAIATENLRPCLVSYYTSDSTRQRKLRDVLGGMTGVDLHHVLIPNIKPRRVLHGARQLPKWSEEEHTQRLRSFFYCSLAIAVASSIDIDRIRMVDNVVMTTAIPMGPGRVGAYRTRTTHPSFLSEMEKVAAEVVSLDTSIENTLALKTKSEAVQILHDNHLTPQITETISCSRPSMARWNRASHCGYCIPCLLRRLALMTTGLDSVESHDTYAYDFLDYESLPDDGKVDLKDLVSFCGDLGNPMTIIERAGPDLITISDDPMMVEKVIEAHIRFGKETLGTLTQRGSRRLRRVLGL